MKPYSKYVEYAIDFYLYKKIKAWYVIKNKKIDFNLSAFIVANPIKNELINDTDNELYFDSFYFIEPEQFILEIVASKITKKVEDIDGVILRGCLSDFKKIEDMVPEFKGFIRKRKITVILNDLN